MEVLDMVNEKITEQKQYIENYKDAIKNAEKEIILLNEFKKWLENK